MSRRSLGGPGVGWCEVGCRVCWPTGDVIGSCILASQFGWGGSVVIRWLGLVIPFGTVKRFYLVGEKRPIGVGYFSRCVGA